ncbi:hypothetical protein BC830DRAFT_1225630 [Chytriomyces sp. MP71]|nr:hypothetical protein BC830DRAFT_1225630 [Chytriomyces sp. MP71]
MMEIAEGSRRTSPNFLGRITHQEAMQFALMTVAALAAAAIASALTTIDPLCERLVDDMGSDNSTARTRMSTVGGMKTLNRLGGDYGVDGGSKIAFEFAATDGHVTVTPGFTAIDPTAVDGDAALHPADIIANNYFYFKFIWDDQISSTNFGVKQCEDLTPYQGLYLNVSMPTGSDVYLTLTQKNKACDARIQDSTYVKLSQFHTPNGSPQAFFIPFSLMAKEFDGVTDYDFAHAKDATFVNFVPPNVDYSFYHVGLVNTGASCTPSAGSAASSVVTTTGAGSKASSAAATSAGSTASTNAPVVPNTSKNGAVGAVGIAAAIAGACLLA